jgi:hypothetical protein
MTAPFTGGCACGAIRYECTAEPFDMLRCHCRDCQRATGGPFSSVVYVPANAFKVTHGVLRYFHTPSLAGGHNKRGHCGDCGSPISGAETERGIGIHAASLDDPSWFRAQMEIHVADAQPWDALDPALPRFEQYPAS